MTKEEAIRILSTRDAHGVMCGYTSGVTEALDMAIKALNDRPNGKWIKSKTARGYVACSNCNKLTTNINRKKYNYCPFCGADVRSGVM